jgi:RHS repeat-associated protein
VVGIGILQRRTFGFNGKENDNEVKGEGNQQDYGMRIYDGRIGKFLSVDPITKKYPELTPYQFASNSPISGIDEDGLEWAYYDKDNKQVSINKSTTNEDKFKISEVRWLGYDEDVKGKKTPKVGTVETAYTFGEKGMLTMSSEKYSKNITWQSYESLSTGDKQADINISSIDPRLQNDMKSVILMARLRFGLDVRGAQQGGFRNYAEQDKLFAKGASMAKGGKSNHNFALAIDATIYENGKYLNKGSEWQYKTYGDIAKKRGLKWGGDWKTFFDPAHIEFNHNLTMKQLRALPKDANGFLIKLPEIK